MDAAKDCIFCKIVKGEIPSAKVWEDNEFYAFLDIHPTQLGHTLIIPKEHIDYVFDMNDSLYKKMFEIARTLGAKIQHATNAVKIGMAIEGISVRHVHLHLVPVNAVNDLDPCKGHSVDKQSLEDMQKKILHSLKENL